MKNLLLICGIVLATTGSALAGPNPRRVAIVIYDGVEILDVAGPAEVISVADQFAGDDRGHALEVYTVARTADPITAQGFIKIVPQYTIGDAPRPDLVVVPGGDVSGLSDDPQLMTWLTQASAASEATLAVCTGALPLAQRGMLDGLEITTWVDAIADLRALAPKARVSQGRRFIDNGRFITTAGVSAGIDGSLHLVARLFGRRVADQTARYMEVRWTPEPYLSNGYVYWNPTTDELGRGLQAAAAAEEEKRVPDAIATLRKLTSNDRTGVAWISLGGVLSRSGDLKGAIAAYREVGPNELVYRKAVYRLARTYALAGDKANALTNLAKAMRAGVNRDQAIADPAMSSIRDQIKQLR
jgi:putative intracellular protease/amidase